MFKKKSKYNIAIVGATGIVGESLLDIINEKNFPIDNIVPLASHRSVGSNVKFGKELITVKDLATYDFKDIDIAFFLQEQKCLNNMYLLPLRLVQ